VANISVGQMKKLKSVGIVTMAGLAGPQAIGSQTGRRNSGKTRRPGAIAMRDARRSQNKPGREAALRNLAAQGPEWRALGVAALPPIDPGDVFFDMEGYPLIPGGLEYLFGTWALNETTGAFEFRDWWAHDRDEEKVAFEGFIDWVFDRWKKNPAMHIYHYASYECCSVRRLSTRHDTRQDEVDDLLRNNVFVDLYQIVRHALRVGEDSYSIKSIETLYRPKRSTDVVTASQSIVQYANWMATRQPRDWESSDILKGIRDYNKDDCKSNAELCEWVRKLAKEKGISYVDDSSPQNRTPKPADPAIAARQQLAAKLRAQGNLISIVLGDLVDFHRREQKPMWWKMFDRAEASDDELRDDPACLEGIEAHGDCVTEKKSLLQTYRFDPSQECKLDVGDTVMFTHNLDATFAVAAMDAEAGETDT